MSSSITLEDAFALEAAKNATTHPVIAITQNGDITFGSMGNTILAQFLELDKLVILNTPPKKSNYKKNHKYEPVTILEKQQTEIFKDENSKLKENYEKLQKAYHELIDKYTRLKEKYDKTKTNTVR
jgi:hypothetical protein